MPDFTSGSYIGAGCAIASGLKTYSLYSLAGIMIVTQN